MDVFTEWAKTDRFFQRIMYGDDTTRVGFNNWDKAPIRINVMGGFAIRHVLKQANELHGIPLDNIMHPFEAQTGYITNTHDIDMECSVDTMEDAHEAANRMYRGILRFCEAKFKINIKASIRNNGTVMTLNHGSNTNQNRLIVQRWVTNNTFNSLRDKHMYIIIGFTFQKNGKEWLQVECGMFRKIGNKSGKNMNTLANRITPSLDFPLSNKYGIPVKKVSSILEEQLSTLLRENLKGLNSGVTYDTRNPFTGTEPEKGKKTAFRVYALCNYIKLLRKKGIVIPNTNRFIKFCTFDKELCKRLINTSRLNNAKAKSAAADEVSQLLRSITQRSNMNNLFGIKYDQ